MINELLHYLPEEYYNPSWDYLAAKKSRCVKYREGVPDHRAGSVTKATSNLTRLFHKNTKQHLKTFFSCAVDLHLVPC